MRVALILQCHVRMNHAMMMVDLEGRRPPVGHQHGHIYHTVLNLWPFPVSHELFGPFAL